MESTHEAITREHIRNAVSIGVHSGDYDRILEHLVRHPGLHSNEIALIIGRDGGTTLVYKPSYHDKVLRRWCNPDIIAHALDNPDMSMFDAVYDLARNFMIDYICGFLGIE